MPSREIRGGGGMEAETQGARWRQRCGLVAKTVEETGAAEKDAHILVTSCRTWPQILRMTPEKNHIHRRNN